MKEELTRFFVARGAVIVILGIIGIIGYFAFNKYQISKIDSFEKCAKKFPVMETYPAQCKANGQTFIDR